MMPRWMVISLVLSFLVCSVCFAQSREPDNSWLMQNYHFAGAPAPGTIPQSCPLVAQLQEIQNTILSIMRKADFAWDFEGALAAAEQATATAQLIGEITGELKPPQPPGPMPPPPMQPLPDGAKSSKPQRDGAHYLVALKDGTVETASTVSMDHRMLHYLTPQGAHVQVRLDLVDWKRTAELNRGGDSGLPQMAGR
jgi:hypothetical protein